MTAHTTSSDEYGYGRGGYGAGGYGHPHTDDDDDETSIDPEPTPDPTPIPPMPDDNSIRLTANVTPEDEWPEDMFRSEEEIREIVREMDLGGDGIDPDRIEDIEVSLQDLAQLVEELESRPVGGGDGGTSPGLDDELAEIRRARRELELVGSPRHTRTIADGPHEDDGFHPYGAWGLVVTAEEDVHWREAAVHAESEGTARLDVYTMDYEPNETYDVGDRLMTREMNLTGGRQTVYPDVMLHRGQTYFITRDSTDPAGSDVVPLKRGAENVDWGAYNDSEVPLTFECSWQLGRSGPGSQAFSDYRDAGWHRVMHHWRSLEFGYNEEG